MTMHQENKTTSIPILLNTFEKVHAFVSAISAFDNDFSIYNNANERIDAKSVLGIFLLDLSKPHDLIIGGEGNHEAIREAIAPYLYREE